MKLTELQPELLKRQPGGVSIHYVQDIKDADGITFLCPVCFQKNGGESGTHHIMCWRPSVPPDVSPKPGRWEFRGSGLQDISLVSYPLPGGGMSASSVLLPDADGCKAHFHVTNGDIVM